MDIFHTLVIGGGNQSLYGNGFFEVGGHPTSNFGSEKDWNKLSFWQDLNIVVKNHKFKYVLFDQGSESWLSNINTLKFVETFIIEHFDDLGIVICESFSIINKNFVPTFSLIFSQSLNHIGKIRFDSFGNVFDIYSTKYANLQNIYVKNISNIHPADINPGTYHENGYVIYNSEFTKTQETDQISFIKNRML